MKKSTKQTDKKKAWEIALAIEQAEAHARSDTLTEQTVKKLIGEILERTTGEPLHAYKVREWFEHWLDIKSRVRAEKSIARYRQVVRDFLGCLGTRANLALAHIASKDVLKYRDSITAAGKSARTANLSVKVVSAGLNAAYRQGHIKSNPCLVLESLSEDGEGARMPFTRAQVVELVRTAKGDWPLAVQYAYYTGARLGDVANMTWDAIDWRNRTIRFVAHKTGREIVIPLHDDLRRALVKSDKVGIGRAKMFPMLAGKPSGGRNGLSGQFRLLMRKAGIQGKPLRRHGGRTTASLSFHSLRHSFASEMANRGISEEVRMKLAGHSTRDVHAEYSHHELQTLRAAIAVLPRLT